MGIGFAPTDIYINEPYFYVNNWSKEGIKFNSLPNLNGGGYWHTTDWTGAILKISSLVEKDSTNYQVNQMINFINSAISSTLNLLK